MKLNIKELLDFFDNPSIRGHASAIAGIIGEELNASVYKKFRNNKVEILDESVTSGVKKGKWLDRWFVDKNTKTLYQCEIKNWAAHAIGGKKLKSDASDDKIRWIADYHWKRELKNSFSKRGKHPNGVTKVLLTMRKPNKYKKLKVEPLLIYWMPISSLSGKEINPLSVLPVRPLHLPIRTKFSRLNIFSVSLHLRQLYKMGKGQKIIDLDMPHLEHRLKILNNLQSKK